VERESPVGFSAAILAEYKSREAIGAPPFKWRRQAELACCRSWHTLSTKETIQVRTNPRDKVFHVCVLSPAGMSNAAKKKDIWACSPSSLLVLLAVLSGMFHPHPLTGEVFM